MAQDIRLMWPSVYDPITDTHVMTVGKGAGKKMYMFTSEEWNNYAYVNGSFKENELARHPRYTAEAARLNPSVAKAKDYSIGWTDPRGLSYMSTDKDREAMDAKIRKEYDSLFDAAKLSGLAVSKASWSTVASPSSWGYIKEKEELPMNPFLDKVLKMEYVGSRVTCSPAPTDTDEDVLLLTDDKKTLIGDCIEVGFKWDSDVTKSYPDSFVSLRNGTMNLIITDDEEFFKKFMLATHVCKSLNVMEKSHRITVFQAILYGKEYVEETLPF
jgi:hypothetical protein